MQAIDRLNHLNGFVFDLDGTLLDSMWVWGEVDRRFLLKRGIELPGDYMEAVNALEFSQAADYTINRFGLNDTPETLIREWTDLSREAYANEVKLKPMAKEYLTFLKARGAKLGVATSSAEELFIPALKNNGIYDCFSAIVTTRQVSRGKKFPDVYLETARQMNVKPEECAVFEDTLSGLQGAASGGFLTVGVYDALSTADQDQMICKADLYIRSFSELLQTEDRRSK